MSFSSIRSTVNAIIWAPLDRIFGFFCPTRIYRIAVSVLNALQCLQRVAEDCWACSDIKIFVSADFFSNRLIISYKCGVNFFVPYVLQISPNKISACLLKEDLRLSLSSSTSPIKFLRWKNTAFGWNLTTLRIVVIASNWWPQFFVFSVPIADSSASGAFSTCYSSDRAWYVVYSVWRWAPVLNELEDFAFDVLFFNGDNVFYVFSGGGPGGFWPEWKDLFTFYVGFWKTVLFDRLCNNCFGLWFCGDLYSRFILSCRTFLCTYLGLS